MSWPYRKSKSPLYGPDEFRGGGTRQGGFAVAVNTETGDYVAEPRMGRLDRENTFALPSYDQLTMLTTNDMLNRPPAQVYMYLADPDLRGGCGHEARTRRLRVTPAQADAVA
jgi:hypothetical protein